MHGRTYARLLSGRFFFIAFAAIAALIIAPAASQAGTDAGRPRRPQR